MSSADRKRLPLSLLVAVAIALVVDRGNVRVDRFVLTTSSAADAAAPSR